MRRGSSLLLAMMVGAGAWAPGIRATAQVRDPTPPMARGDAGPLRHVTVATVRAPGMPEGTFAVELLTADGRRMALPGPDEPTDFFLLDPKVVAFAPVDRSGRDGVVVLYDSSRIGPGRGTDRRALVYRVDAAGATRLPGLEARLEGVATARAARARLAAAPR